MSNSIFLDTNDGISDVNPNLNWEGVDEKKLIRFLSIKILLQMTDQDILNEYYRQMEIQEAANRPVLELEYQVDASIKTSFVAIHSLLLVKLDYIEQRILTIDQILKN